MEDMAGQDKDTTAVSEQSKHATWSSQWAFIFAAAGSAIGLGNIWKFPYITGNNGGGIFVLIYLFCIFFIGIPLLMAELLIGRRGAQNPIASMRKIAVSCGHSKQWQWLGVLFVLAGFLIVSYYCVIAGWAVDYTFKSALNQLPISATTATTTFKQLTQSPGQLIIWQTLVVIVTAGILSKGIRNGLERALMFMFPLLIILMAVMLVYSMFSGYFTKGIHFLFNPHYKDLTSQGILIALGHAFFSLSIAVGAIMVYGSYLPKNVSITRAAVTVGIADTLVALVSGMIIFPIVFANGLAPGSGPGLIFTTLPLAFSHMPWGAFFATLFFLMLVCAALTSSVSLLEPAVAWLMETFKCSRAKAAWGSGLVAWIVGLGTVFSFNHWQDYKLFGHNFFNLIDYVTAHIFLPLGGLLLALFVGWTLNKTVVQKELGLGDGIVFKCWKFSMCILTPIAIFIVFLDLIHVI